VLVLALAACEREPIEWGESARLAPAEVASAGPAWRLAVSAQGIASPARTAALAWSPAGACGGSVAIAHERGGDWQAVWWRARDDSSAVLETARTRDDGATWSAPMAVDSSDRARRGCARPAPAVVADSVTGFVHVAYFAEPPGGGAVWLVHSMDRGASWHPPVALAYGADPAAASVAASGDTVLVAYESPNANEGWVDLAISTSAGHVIDRRLVAVSGRSVATQAPRVALRGRAFAVAWITAIGALAMARAGALR
jgi:hypothetical protein